MATLDAPLTVIANHASRANGNGAFNHSNGDPPEAEPAPPVAISFDPDVFRSFLLSLLPPLFGATFEELEYIFDDDFPERASRFAGEGGGVIYVVKKKDEHECESISTSFHSLYTQLHQLRMPHPHTRTRSSPR